MPEDYKGQLLEQIEERRRKKEEEKKRKLEQEMLDDMRVHREIEELNHKYQQEVEGVMKLEEKKTVI